MLKPYREVFAAPGSRAFSLAGFVARMPISMIGIGIVLLVATATGSYGVAGTISATAAFAEALAGPRVGRLVDRLGQARVAVPAMTVFATGMAALLLCARAGAPRWTLYLAAAVAGAALPNAGAMVRARWARLYGGTAGTRLHTAYAVESVADELVYIIGPVLATVLATKVSPTAGLLAVIGFAVTGNLALAAQRGTEPPPSGAPARRPGGSVALLPGMPVLLLVFAALGVLFGGLEIIVVAFASAHGQRPAAGIVLAGCALGSLLSGLAVGAVRLRTPPHRRFVFGTLALGLSVWPLPFAPSLPWLAAMCFLVGFTIAPTLISGFALAESLVPPDRLTEGFTWLSTGVLLGVTAGTSVAGRVIDQAGPGHAFFVTVVSGAIAAVIAGAGASRLRPRRTEEEQREHASLDQLGR